MISVFFNLVAAYFSKVQMLNQKYSDGVSIIENDDKQELTVYSGKITLILAKLRNDGFAMVVINLLLPR